MYGAWKDTALGKLLEMGKKYGGKREEAENVWGKGEYGGSILEVEGERDEGRKKEREGGRSKGERACQVGDTENGTA